MATYNPKVLAELVRRSRDITVPLTNGSGGPVIGHVAGLRPDGTAELVFNDDGRRLFGQNVRTVVMSSGVPAADDLTADVSLSAPAEATK